jgi:hypothetical protein
LAVADADISAPRYGVFVLGVSAALAVALTMVAA